MERAHDLAQSSHKHNVLTWTRIQDPYTTRSEDQILQIPEFEQTASIGETKRKDQQNILTDPQHIPEAQMENEQKERKED